MGGNFNSFVTVKNTKLENWNRLDTHTYTITYLHDEVHWQPYHDTIHCQTPHSSPAEPGRYPPPHVPQFRAHAASHSKPCASCWQFRSRCGSRSRTWLCFVKFLVSPDMATAVPRTGIARWMEIWRPSHGRHSPCLEANVCIECITPGFFSFVNCFEAQCKLMGIPITLDESPWLCRRYRYTHWLFYGLQCVTLWLRVGSP